MQSSDHAIVLDWFNRREADAFRAIVGRHAAMVYATCRRMLGNDSEAEEVAQECFEVLATVPPKQAPPREIGPWLHGVAVNKSLMRLRAEGRRRKYESRYAAEQPSHTRADWDDVRDLIDEAVAELPEELRAPTVHHFFYGQSHGEIARAAGIPRRTISNRIGKAVEIVGESLRKRGLQVSTAALAAMVLGGLSEAVAAPTAVMTSLGNVALENSTATSATILAAGGAGFSLQIKLLAAALTVAVLAGVGLGANHVYQSKPVSGATPSGSQSMQSTVAVRASVPGSEALDETRAVVPVPPAQPGESGSISGRVTDATITAQGYLSLLLAASNDALNKLKADESLVKPRPGIEIHLGAFKEDGIGQVLQSAHTDEAGRYSFGNVPAGRYALHLVPPPEACPWRDAKPDNVKHIEVKTGQDTKADFAFQDGISIRGRATDKSGSPIRGAAVDAVPIVSMYWDQSYARVEEKARQSTITAEDGSYTVHGVVPASIRDASCLVGMGGCAGGVVEVTVAAQGYATTSVYTHAVTESLAREASWAYDEFRRKLPANYPVDLPPRPASIPLASCEGDTLTDIDLVLEPVATISGSLVTTKGRTLPKTTLSILFAEEDGPLKVASDADASGESPEGRIVYFEGTPFKPYPVLPEAIQTDANGAFTFTSLSVGTYRFEAQSTAGRKQKARNGSVVLRAAQQMTGLEVVVEDPEDRLTLKGVVVDAGTRQPLDEYSIWVKKVEAPGEASPLPGEFKKDEKEKGRFSISDVSPGVVTLEAKSPGYGTAEFHVDLKKQAERETAFPLEREAVLTGRVTVNGEPKDAQVIVDPVDGGLGAYANSSKETGEYTINEIKPGEYKVSTYIGLEGITGNTQRSINTHATLIAGKTIQVDFDFAGSASISGTMSAPKELIAGIDVLAGSFVGAIPPSDSSEYREALVAGAWDFRYTDSYRISLLPPGVYTVVGNIGRKEDDKVTRLDQEAHTVTLAEGENAEFNFDFSE